MPTFGKTTDGGSSTTSSSTRCYVSRATPSSSGIVTDGSMRLALLSGTAHACRMCIFADDGSDLPGAFLASSDESTVTSTTESAIPFTFSGADRIPVVGNTQYWIGIGFGADASNPMAVSRDNLVVGARQDQSAYTYPNFPDPFGTPSGSGTGTIDASITYVLPTPSLGRRQTNKRRRLYMSTR